MSPKRRDVYRGKHKLRFPVTLVVSVLLILAAAAVILFISLQKYAVYGKDGVTLAIPGLTETAPLSESAEPSGPKQPTPVHQVSAELVVDPADYSGVDLHPGEELGAIRGRYLSCAALLSGATGGLGLATDESAALVLEMVTPEGTLSWASSNATAQGFGVNGQADLNELVTALKDKGYYLVAQVSCCRATLLAKRSPSLALRNAVNEPYTDERGGWLDPYDLGVRDYLQSLAQELTDAGFDEILFSGLSFPENDAVVSYSEAHTGASTPRAAVSGLAVWLARNAPEGVVISAELERSALYGTGEADKESPQDASLFLRLFDRLYLRTDAYNLASDSDALQALAQGELALRFVPITAESAGTDCNFIDTPAA